MYTLAIVGVYACLASGGRVTGDRHAFLSRCQRSAEQAAARSYAFFDARLRILFLKSLIRSLRRAASKKEQPPDGSCSLIPEGFHSIYFIPYI